MKKILVSAMIAVFFVTMPFVSFAKTAIFDGELDARKYLIILNIP